MKIRNGFVTNSSSSSFIISVRVPEELAHHLDVLEEFMKPFVKKFISSEDELKVWFEYLYGDGYIEEEYSAEIYDKCLKAIQDGYSVFEKTVEYGDESGYDSVGEMRKNSNYIIIDEGELT